MLTSLIPLLLMAPPTQAQAPYVIGMEELHRLDMMPAFKRSVKIGAVTSYDRTGGNDDGFSGKYSFVAKEGDDLVLADLKGPGVIYRFHTPTPTDDKIEFFFDGEATPRISMPNRDLFSGKVAPFVRPVVDYAGGGAYSYVPIPYKKSCKIILRAKSFQFYDLNYATYPADAPISSFDMKKAAADTANLNAAKAVFGYQADLTKYNVPKGTKLTTTRFEKALPAGKSVTLWESKKAGRIAALKIGPADAFAGKNRDVLLRITFDGEKTPAVYCPAGDFFGYGWGRPASGSRFVGTSGDMNYCYLPMPYRKAAKIELVSAGSAPVSVHGEVVSGNTGQRDYEGKFYAVWRRERPTTIGKPFTFLQTQGQGHIVGLGLQAQGPEPGHTTFFEGDDTTTIDGELVVHGTGSEDFFNGGWYDCPGRWDRRFARALSGCMDYQKHLGRTGAYRFYLGDAPSYRKSILQTIEHAPTGNNMLTDYCAVTYLYSKSAPSGGVAPTLQARQVDDPTKAIFSADWAVPIVAFALNSATVSRKNVPLADGKEARCLSLRTNPGDFFGPPFIILSLDLPAAGRYKVYADVVKGPDAAIVQMCEEENPIGEPVDLYAEKAAVANRIYLGEVTAVQGPNRVNFKLVGKNPTSKTHGFDLMRLVCEKA